MIRVDGVSRCLPGPDGPLSILDAVTFAVSPGELALVSGRSGSGKSTLLFILGLLDRPSTGRYELAGVDTSALDRKGLDALRGRTIGFVFQNFYLMPGLSAWENVVLPLDHVTTGARREGVARARELVDVVGIGHRLDHRPAELSGGEQQRVALARALLRRPRVLLADEPTGSLDRTTGGAIAGLLAALCRDQQLAAVVASHDVDLIGPHAQQHVRLVDGRLHPAGVV